MKITTTKVAELLELSMPSIYRLMAEGHLPYEKKGNRALFNLEDVVAYKEHRNGDGQKIASVTIYPSSHIMCLIDLLKRFESHYAADKLYEPIFVFHKILTSTFETAVLAHKEGRYTSYNGSKINQVMIELRKKDVQEEGIYSLIAGRLYEIYAISRALHERLALYTDLLIDLIMYIHQQETPTQPISIFLPKEETLWD